MPRKAARSRAVAWGILAAQLLTGCSGTPPNADATVVLSVFGIAGGDAPPGYRGARAVVREHGTTTPIGDARVFVTAPGLYLPTFPLQYDPSHEQWEGFLGEPSGSQLTVEVDGPAGSLSGTSSEPEYQMGCYLATPTVDETLHWGFPVHVSSLASRPPIVGQSGGIGLLDAADINGPLLWPATAPGHLATSSDFLPLNSSDEVLDLPTSPVSPRTPLFLVVESPVDAWQLRGAGSGSVSLLSLCGASFGMSSAELISLEVRGPGIVSLGVSGPVFADGHFDDGTWQAFARSARWSSSAPNVASVDAGFLTTVGEGDAVITATFRGHSGSTTVSVGPPQ